MDLDSTRRDLSDAAHALEILSDLDEGQPFGVQDDDVGMLGRALLVQAVTLYVRATKTRSNARKPVAISEAFSKDERAVHQRICNIRDDALAHYGVGMDELRPWASHKLVFIQRDDGDGRFVFPAKGTNWRANLALDLYNLLSVARKWLDSTLLTKLSDLDSALDLASSQDEWLASMCRASVFEPERFFPDQLNVDDFWEGRTEIRSVRVPAASEY